MSNSNFIQLFVIKLKVFCHNCSNPNNLGPNLNLKSSFCTF